MARKVYIGKILIADTVVHKITHRAAGGCVPDEVREAFLSRSDVELQERDDGSISGFGTTSDGRRLFAAFEPQDPTDGVWILKSAWPV